MPTSPKRTVHNGLEHPLRSLAADRVFGVTGKTNLLKRFKLMLPVQSLSQKYSRSLLTQISCISLAIPAHTKGRFAIVTSVGQGMRWTQHVKDE